MHRKLSWLFTALLLALTDRAEAQQPAKTARIGYISSFGTAPESQIRAFREGLNDLGYSRARIFSLSFVTQRQDLRMFQI
jgi:hypothetical protein